MNPKRSGLQRVRSAQQPGSQNVPKEQLPKSWAHKNKCASRPTTAPAKQARVLIRALEGQGQREIARKEGLHRSTVVRILSQPEFMAVLTEARSHVARLLPKAVDTLEHHLDKKDLQAALATLHGMQILVPRSQQQVAVGVASEFADRTDEELEHFAQTGKWPGEPEDEI